MPQSFRLRLACPARHPRPRLRFCFAHSLCCPLCALSDFFRDSVGEVARVEIISYPSGRSKGCAIVEFASVDDAARAINECSNQEIAGRKIFLREDREEKGFSTRSQPCAGAP